MVLLTDEAESGTWEKGLIKLDNPSKDKKRPFVLLPPYPPFYSMAFRSALIVHAYHWARRLRMILLGALVAVALVLLASRLRQTALARVVRFGALAAAAAVIRFIAAVGAGVGAVRAVGVAALGRVNVHIEVVVRVRNVLAAVGTLPVAEEAAAAAAAAEVTAAFAAAAADPAADVPSRELLLYSLRLLLVALWQLA